MDLEIAWWQRIVLWVMGVRIRQPHEKLVRVTVPSRWPGMREGIAERVRQKAWLADRHDVLVEERTGETVISSALGRIEIRSTP